jgi:hypothetical protein
MTMTTNTRSNSMGVVNYANGYMVSNADAAAPVELSLGFTPRQFRITNLTDRISYEWQEGMASGSAIKTIATGVRTLDASGDLTVAGSLVDLAAALVIASKSFAWEAQG